MRFRAIWFCTISISFFDSDCFFQAIDGSVEVALAKAREIEGCFAEGFTGDGAGVSRDATDDSAFDDPDGLAEFGGLHRGLLAGRSAPYDEKIVLGHVFILKEGRG
jgi:hypothetical protein